jgi:hypothetical protein
LEPRSAAHLDRRVSNGACANREKILRIEGKAGETYGLISVGETSVPDREN